MGAEVSLLMQLMRLMREGITLYDSYDNVDEQDAFDGHEGEDWGTTQHQKFLTYDIPTPAIRSSENPELLKRRGAVAKKRKCQFWIWVKYIRLQ